MVRSSSLAIFWTLRIGVSPLAAVGFGYKDRLTIPHSKVYVANMGSPGSRKLKAGPMLAPRTLLLGYSQTHIKGKYLEHFMCHCPQVNTTSHQWWLVMICFRQEQVITWMNVDPDIWRQQATIHLGRDSHEVVWYCQYFCIRKLFSAFSF